MPEIASVATPWLVRVTVWAAVDVRTGVEPNSMEVALRTGSGPPVPVPLRLTIWGELAAESLKLTVAVLLPD